MRFENVLIATEKGIQGKDITIELGGVDYPDSIPVSIGFGSAAIGVAELEEVDGELRATIRIGEDSTRTVAKMVQHGNVYPTVGFVLGKRTKITQVSLCLNITDKDIPALKYADAKF